MAILFNVVDSQDQAQNISEKLLVNWTPIGPDSPELPGNVSPFISGFELGAHFSIGQTNRALDLIRATWGWYISNPLGTESTVIEGYLTNGSFGYRNTRGYDFDSSYVSHSHGWGSGPTAALTNYVLGLSVLSPAGAMWKLAPQFGNLTSVEGGFTTSLGQYQASWIITSVGYDLNFSAPVGTTGQVVLPTLVDATKPTIQFDGANVPKSMNAQLVGNTVVLDAQGGDHTIVVSLPSE
jgi:hypothetical protein